jgi:lipopolysaccharide transport system ATP-binding protein
MPQAAITVENVSRKFCRNRTRGALYAAADIARQACGRPAPTEQRRPGEFWALDGLSFTIHRGECVGLVGANGSGKSTLLKLIAGILRPDRGQVRVRGRVGALIELGAGFHPLLSGRENVYVNGAILGMSGREITRKLDAIIDFSGLDAATMDAPVGTYSSGMYARLGFSVALHSDPDILLIDEVLAVGDTAFQSRCFNALGEVRARGTTILYVSHNLNHIAGWTDRALALDAGRLLAEGAPAEVIQTYSELVTRREAESRPALRMPNGSGVARVVDVAVCDSHGRALDVVTSGDCVRVAVTVEAQERIEGLELDLRVFGEDNRLLSGGSTRYTTGNLTIAAGRSRILAEYPPLPLNAGVIRPRAVLWRKDRSELLDWLESAPIPVRGLAASQGELWWMPTYRVDFSPELQSAGGSAKRAGETPVGEQARC